MHEFQRFWRPAPQHHFPNYDQISSLLALILAAALATDGSAAEARPNFVFFLADDFGYMDIGANNPKTFYETPNIDASPDRHSVHFRSRCLPRLLPDPRQHHDRKYPARIGITDYIGANRPAKLLPAPNKNHLALEEVTLAEALRDAGYTNFFAGKWHLGKGSFPRTAQGFGPGLDRQRILLSAREMRHPGSRKTIPRPPTGSRMTPYVHRRQQRIRFFAYLPFLAVHIPIGASAPS